MISTITRLDRRVSHRDLWPWPLCPNEDFQLCLRVYRKSIEIFFDSEFLPERHTSLTDAALELIDQWLPELAKQPRWANYQTSEMGDMNVAMHTLRQTGTSAQALSMDVKAFGLGYSERDISLAATVLHDLGELAEGDATYDIKRANKRQMEIAEAKAVFNMIDAYSDIDQKKKSMLKEIYLRVATSLEETDVQKLHQEETQFNGVNWESLRVLFELYERYGYLITAIQQYPLITEGLTEENLESLLHWNRAELETALAENEDIPTSLRQFILFKNVVLNQWEYISSAIRDGLPSATYFFTGFLAERILKHANDLMQLGLDLSIFDSITEQ